MATYNLGRFLPIFKGNYNILTTYNPLDIVYYNGSSYVCKQTALGKTPTNTTYWQIVALKGELSPTLSPEQIASIIEQIQSESGWVVDENYVHTDNNFSATYKEAVDNIGDATLTIKRNNVSLGSINMNSSTSQTINITVPTAITDLTGTNDFITTPEVIKVSESDYPISTLKNNTVYHFLVNPHKISIGSVDYEDMGYKNIPVYFDFTTDSDEFTWDDNGLFGYVDGVKPDQFGTHYRIKIYAGVADVKVIQ